MKKEKPAFKAPMSRQTLDTLRRVGGHTAKLTIWSRHEMNNSKNKLIHKKLKVNTNVKIYLNGLSFSINKSM